MRIQGRLFTRVCALAAMLVSGAVLFLPATASARRHRSHTAAGANCANANALATAAPKQELRTAEVCLINAQRTSRGLPALKESPRLDRSAQRWTNVMVNTGVFSHGSDFAARITAAGFHWSFAGENIAAGFDTPAAVVTAWMGSPDHCRNILDPSYSYIGTGVSPHRLANIGPATWTQDFGLPAGQQPPSGRTGPQNGCPY
jgi:uncharacterized protein YkwD